jgi:formylglycine-generating enzyme required for sulfatase activity/cephalosporin-C deacetylase-like acetyl esterase
MSPEQLQGKAADARSDIFAFGAVLYEMLTGQRAFQRQSHIETIAAVDREEPKPLHEFVKDIPDGLERIIRRCLRKRSEERYASILEIERGLEDCRALASEPASGINLKVLFRQSKRLRVAMPVLLLLAMFVSLFAWWIHHSSRVKWARDQALPQIAQLIEKEKFGDAYVLAVQAERYIPHDPMLAKFWPDISWSQPINTTPPRASVFRKDYNAPDKAWEFIGITPIEKRRLPLVDSRWKFELKGFATVERATFPSDSLTITMDEGPKAPSGMVHVELSTSMAPQTTPVTLFGIAGFDDLPPIQLGDYWMDRYEVTNKQFKQFLDQGGYRKQEYWKQEFRKDGRAISWSEAMTLFRDTTGRPGPARWVQGEYPRGQEDFPVTGVSWFEAAAYAEFSGKLLPTIYHWTIAASPGDSPSIIPASNFDGHGPARVGSYRGMSWSGVYDMAGNAKEWCWNEATPGKRYIMGGASDEPAYMFNDADARSPFERSANFGFRTVKYDSTGPVTQAADPITLQARDFTRETPVSDPLFHAYKSLFSYDKTPLHAAVESAEQTDDWKREKITFAAAYGNERIIAYLFLPIKASPPFQTVVYFPGADAIHSRSSTIAPQLEMYDFIVKSGRAVLFPTYKGTFERRDGLKRGYPNTTSSYRDHVIAWSKDLGRSIDYLETRPDIDHNKLAYEGVSWGAAMGSLLPAVEDRFRALLLVSPGFYLQKCLPEVDQLNFAPRVKVPVLMLNGRFDFIFPIGTSQEPLFRLLGTPNEQKRRVIYETGHDIPRNEQIKETLDWLDRYLGPVK